MIDEVRLRDDLSHLLTSTEDNIRRRCDEEPTVNQPLQERYEAARKAGRTGMTFNVWRDGEITQAGVAWLLACVFVRFLEDNDLLGDVYLSGPGGRLKDAQDRRTFWYRAHPVGNDREYLLDVFLDLECLPGLEGLLDRAHNPLWQVGPDGEGAKAILDFFQSANPDSGDFRHDFTDTSRSTRFLGDLYQNISESARKRYALVQTPGFIVNFILDRTLSPALDEFGLERFRLIDPACGSGHFLLSAFERLFPLWDKHEENAVVAARKTLECIVGVDLNPFAVAIARFRLLIAAIRVCGIQKLSATSDWSTHVTAGDSLLFGPGKMVPALACLPTESPEQLRTSLQTEGYHAVVGNPPYINVQDPELRRLYRRYYQSCSGKYQVSVPFTQLFFELAERGGYVGLITSNAFMQKAFGRRLVQSYLPGLDLTQVVDTSGVHLPSFGTPTVILIGRNRTPVASLIRVVRGIRGEVIAPDDLGNAPVWTEIRNHSEEPGFSGSYVSVADVPRQILQEHPWSMGGGGAAELKQRLDQLREETLASASSDRGVFGMTNADDIMLAPAGAFKRAGVELTLLRPMLVGEGIKDWSALPAQSAIFPYASGLLPLDSCRSLYRWIWIGRTVLGNRATFNQSTYFAEGKPWWAWHQVALERLEPRWTIVYPFVATHNHFVLDRGGNVFKQTSPIIKLAGDRSEADHIAILGTLNSSVSCFWLRQVCRNKGTGGIGGGLATEVWEQFFEFDSTNVSQLPLPAGRPFELATAIQTATDERSSLLPAALIAREVPTRAALDTARDRAAALLQFMIALQEELDWHVYHLYRLHDESLTLPIRNVPPVRLGERAFEIVMARAIEAGELETEWFARHGSTPCTIIPEHWPEPYRALVRQRIDTIAQDRDLALIEQPQHKRRWNLPAWEKLEEEALRNWVLNHLEEARYWPTNPPALSSIARLADAVRLDSDFRRVAELYRGRPDFDLPMLVHGLVAKESVPFLPILRYKESGLRKRSDWERTWDLQRREDVGEKVDIPVPPKYDRDDFLSADYWTLRGKLDVPKERFISYPHLERDTDKSLVIAWAGYDHGQQALALAGYCYEMRGNQGWSGERLIPILAGLRELQPWLDQWHNQIDAQTQQRMNEFIRNFFETELTQLEITAEQVRNWRPPVRTRRGRRSQ